MQNTLHFDDFFFMKKIVKLCLRTNNTKVEIFFHFGDFVFLFQWCNVQFVRGFANHRANRPVFRSDTSRSVWQWQAGLYSDVSRPLFWVPRRNSISSKCKKFHFDFFLDKVDIIKHDLRINHWEPPLSIVISVILSSNKDFDLLFYLLSGESVKNRGYRGENMFFNKSRMCDKCEIADFLWPVTLGTLIITF